MAMEEGFQQLINQLYDEGKYRPEAVAILYNSKRRFLITKTPKQKPTTPWSFHQGGIKKGESLKQGLARELQKELGVNLETELTDIMYRFYYKRVDFEPTRKDRRPYKKPTGEVIEWEGKAYIFTLAKYTGDGNLELNPKEVAEAKWVPYEEAVNYLNLARPEKAKLLTTVLSKALNLLD